MDTKQIQIGSLVKLHYIGGEKDKDPIDDKLTGKPLEVVIGNMCLPKGIEEALIGMSAGQTKDVDIEAEKGFGIYQAKYAQWYPRTLLKGGYDLKVGDMLFYHDKQFGQRRPAHVTKTTKDNVMIDFNHPLAGKALHYHLEVVDVK